jgi:Fe-S-cluster containining protein
MKTFNSLSLFLPICPIMTPKKIIQIETKVGEKAFSYHKESLFTDNINKKYENKESSCQTVDLDLNILNQSFIFRIYVIPAMIKLSEIVPFARELSSKISDIIRAKLSKQGKSIPCRKGCSTCCCYLVPLSVPEAFRLREEVISMPENIRINILKSCLASARKILDEKPKDLNLLAINHISNWYSSLGLICPLLSDDICSIYDKRPIVCREYLVTGIECQAALEGNFRIIDIPVSIAEALGLLSAEYEQIDTESIMLPLALPWVEENFNRDTKKYPSVEIVQHLIAIIQELSIKSCALAAC